MLKVAVLVCRTVDGALVSEVSDSLVPILEIAKGVRKAGRLNDDMIDCGCVVGNRGQVFDFRCDQNAAAVKAVAVKGHARKAKK